MAGPIVTLTTDWGDGAFFSGMVKGRLYSTIPDVRVVDICHSLKPFDLRVAPFLIKTACTGFPPDTVHIIDILSEEESGEGFVIVRYNSQYYICTNNGLPYMVFGDKYEQAVEIALQWPTKYFNFAAYDIFCEQAARILSGTRLSEIGRDVALVERHFSYMVMDNLIKTHVWHIDSYGNAYLDIHIDELEREINGRRYEISCRGVRIGGIKESYSDCREPSLTVSASGYVEIAMYKQRVCDILGIELLDIMDIVLKPTIE